MKTNISRSLTPVLASIAIAIMGLSGCASTFTQSQLDEKVFKSEPTTVDMSRVIGLGNEAPISYIDAPTPRPVAINLAPNEPLPDIVFKDPLNLYGSSISDALTMILSGTDIALTVMPGVSTNATARITGLKGSLTQILKTIGAAYGVYFSYSNGMLVVEPDREFLIELPPIKDLATTVEKMLTQRGARLVSVDASSGHVTYRATQPASKSIESYLETLLTRPLVTMELNIIEVRLSNADQAGIQWNKLDAAVGTSALASLVTTAAVPAAKGTIGIVGNLTERVSVDVLLKFLATQGTVKTISQPRLQILSGGRAELKIGDTIRYVSKIGATQIAGSTTTQTTAETVDLDTGIRLMVGGAYWQDTVVAKMELEMSELLGFDEIPIGPAQSLKLPRTTKRFLGTKDEPVVMRLVPGEVGLLAGLITTKDNNTHEGLTGVPVLSTLTTTGVSSTKERNELVIVVRPRVIKFGKPPVAVVSAATAQNEGVTQ